MTDQPERATGPRVDGARQGLPNDSNRHLRAASLRKRLRTIVRPVRGLAAFRVWVRGSEVAIVALAILAGGTGGLVAALMGGATHWLHLTLFGPGAAPGLSALRK